SALGKKSSTTVNGFVFDAVITSCLEPHAASVNAAASATAAHPVVSKEAAKRVLNTGLLMVVWPTAQRGARPRRGLGTTRPRAPTAPRRPRTHGASATRSGRR